MDLANTVNSVNTVNTVKQTWADIVKPKESIELTENYDTKIELIEAEIAKREHAFKHSYAYTKYLSDSNRLNSELIDLKEKKELDYYKHIIHRILDYLGHYYLHNYYTDTGYAMTYSLTCCLPPNLLPMGVTWSIVERYGSIHIIFNVDSSSRQIKLESFIQCMLPNFTVKIDPLILP